MASMRCRRCGNRMAPSDRFCTRCSEPASSEARAQRRHCENCGKLIAAEARFCNWCGAPEGRAVAAQEYPELVPAEDTLEPEIALGAAKRESGEPSALPPRELPRPAPREGRWPLGCVLADVGALVALAGCFLPLASGIPENTALVPAVANEWGMAYVVPASAVVVAILAWVASIGTPEQRAVSGGGVIAISSPWAILLLLTALAASQALGYLNPFLGGMGIGIGLIMLLAGFGLSLAAGFVIVHEVARSC